MTRPVRSCVLKLRQESPRYECPRPFSADAKVLAVDERGRGGIGESTSPFTLTIAVDAPESLLVAAAIADGHISIARTTGATSSQGTAPQVLDRAGVSGASR
jgi:hypothetical protein